MQAKNFVLSDNFEDIQRYLTSSNLSSHSRVWVQVFTGETDRFNIQTLLQRLSLYLPEQAIITGATTSGEICEGLMLDLQTIVSICIFEETELSAASLHSVASDFELGKQLALQITTEKTKAVVLFMDGLQVNGEQVISGFSQFAKGAPILAGGMAGDNSLFQQTWLIHNQLVFDKGTVAIALNSDSLHAFNAYNLSWQQLGQKMTITKSEGARVYEIDHRPIIEVYRQYLGDDVVANMPDSTIEFPLIIQDLEIPVARSMVFVFEDQSILFAGDLEVGTKVKFAVADLGALMSAKTSMRDELLQKGVEASFIYSCTARKSFLSKTLEEEFLPIAEISPVAGFFTYGEVYHFNQANRLSSGKVCTQTDTLLNVTTTVLGLRESSEKLSAAKSSTHTSANLSAEKSDFPSKGRQRRSLSNSALIHLVNQTMKELNLELEENNQLIQLLNQYQTAINESFIVSKSDRFGSITYANPLFEKISGYSQQELLGKNHNLVRHPEMPQSVFAQMWQTILSKKVWKGVIKNRAKNGCDYVVKTSIIPILNREGEIAEFLSLREDITAQEMQRELLVSEKLKVQTILDNQSNLVIMTHAEKNMMITANQAFLDFIGYPSLAHFLLKYDCICDLFLPGDGLLQKMMDGVPWTSYVFEHCEKDHVCSMLDKEGNVHKFSVNVTYFKDDESKVIANFADVTQLERTRQRAQQAEASQAMFLANMSHELRTPINGILGFSDLLSNTNLDKEQKRFVDILRSSSRHLLSVVNDILDISKIERGEIELHPHPEQTFIDLEKILVSFSSVAHQKGVKYVVQLSPNLPECLVYDNVRLHQVLANLVSNAIKFTPQQGKVVVNIECFDTYKDKNTVWVHFAIQDTGIGIELEKQTHVFESFKQANSSTTKEYGGTGLGLSIASQLVQKMGGDRIHLDSEIGKGSKFSFTLPMEICKPEVSISEAFKKLRVGVFADKGERLEVLTQYLEHFDIKHETDALEVCQSDCQDGRCVFDVCLVLSIEKFEKVKETYNPKTFYIFFEEPSQEFAQKDNVIWLSDFLENNSHLYNLLLDYIVNVSGQNLINNDNLFAKKVLLVEDNSVNQLLMIKLFEHLKVEADIANNGLEAIERYAQGNYGLVLMDINMPIMGGIEAFEHLAKNAQVSGKPLVPIVALTANVLPDQVLEYKKLGFHSHLAKPIEIHKLTELLSKLNRP